MDDFSIILFAQLMVEFPLKLTANFHIQNCIKFSLSDTIFASHTVCHQGKFSRFRTVMFKLFILIANEVYSRVQ